MVSQAAALATILLWFHWWQHWQLSFYGFTGDFTGGSADDRSGSGPLFIYDLDISLPFFQYWYFSFLVGAG